MSAPESFSDIIRQRQLERPDDILYTFLEGEDARDVSFGELGARAASIGRFLGDSGLRRGEPVLLLYPPGPDFVFALCACLLEGIVAVPAYPPDPLRLARSLPRLQALLADSRATTILTTGMIAELAASFLEGSPVRLLPTDGVPPSNEVAGGARVRESEVAVLQYTSGSTGEPKGVVLSHRNLLHNSGLIAEAFGHTRQSVGVIWLPQYHDMGLIGGILQPLFIGFRVALLSPLEFLQSPVRWLQAISRYRATTSGGPDFAYELCTRKVTEEQRAALDLSSWEVAFCGAEPIRPDTLRRFSERFGPVGFRRSSFYPCYGLAEGTLIVSGAARTAGPRIERFASDSLSASQAQPRPVAEEGVALVSSGQGLGGQRLRIVAPETRRAVAPGTVGEIWVSGPSVAEGYFQRPELSQETFRATVEGEPDGGAWLRTGDLGFLRDGELFVTGRLKDLIIVRGRNCYPQDLERTVETLDRSFRSGCTAAFGVEGARGEEVVVVQEVAKAELDAVRPRARQLAADVARTVTEVHGVPVREVVLLEPGTISKTSSGKIQRRATRREYLEGVLQRLVPAESPAEPVAPPVPSAGSVLLEEERLVSVVRTFLVERGKADAATFEASRPVSAYGLDSLDAVELGDRLEEVTGVPVSAAELLGSTGLLELVRAFLARTRAHAAAAHRSEEEHHPLSEGQAALWFLQEQEPTSSAYNVSKALHIRAGYDREKLRRALEQVALAHPQLRMRYRREADGSISQAASSQVPTPDFVEASMQEESALREAVGWAATEPFDLLAEGPTRLIVFERGPGEAILLMTVHHLAIDFGALPVVLRALARACAEGTVERPLGSYREFVEHQRTWLQGPRAEEALAFWGGRLEDVPELHLPESGEVSPDEIASGKEVAFSLDSGLVRALRRLAEQHGTTLFVALLGVYATLLHRHSGQRTFAIGVPASGRPSRRFRDVVGYFVNTLPIRVDIEEGMGFHGLLDSLRREVVSALEHGQLPLSALVSRFARDRHSRRHPLFQVTLVLERPRTAEDAEIAALALGREGELAHLGGLELESFDVPGRSALFELSLLALDTGADVILSHQYDRRRFSEAAVRRFNEQFVSLARELVRAPRTALTTVPFVPAGQRALLEELCAGPRFSTGPSFAHERVLERCRRSPDAVAVVAGSRTLSYGELEEGSARVARALVRRGLRKGERVAVRLPRGPELALCVLGVLRAGGAFVLLDGSAPDAHVGELVALAEARFVLGAEQLEAGSEGLQRLGVYSLLIEEAASCEIDSPCQPGDLAYVMFTSGTSGRRKGVMIGHGALRNRFAWEQAFVPRGSEDALLQCASLEFDQSIWELFTPLCAGARLVLPEEGREKEPAHLVELIHRHSITDLGLVPAVLGALLEDCPTFDGGSLKHVYVGGEAVSLELVRRFQARCPLATLHNFYGPTESTVDATSYTFPREGLPALVPIGRPLGNLRAYVLDEELHPVPVGVPGELWVAGESLALGYLGQPGLTAERFLADPFGAPGTRMYRTGDRVRLGESSQLEFLGRADDQLKVRGVRIEPAEVEARLLALPGVREAFVSGVVAEDDPRREKRLAAWLVLESGKAFEPAQLQRSLRERLPTHLVPTLFSVVEALPRTRTGKVARERLPKPSLRSVEAVPGEAPRPGTETRLAELWRRLLELPALPSREDDFFSLGGHSLLAMRLTSAIRAELGVELPLRRIFELPVLARLAESLPPPREPVRRPLLPSGGRERYRASHAQERIWILEQLEPRPGLFNLPGVLKLRGPLPVSVLEAALQRVVSRQESLRTAFEVVEGRLYQRVHPVVPGLPVMDLSGVADEAERRARAELEVERERTVRFDWHVAPLMRARLLKLAEDEHWLLLTLHHAICDGWSVSVLARELGRAYAEVLGGASAGSGSSGPSYGDFAEWEHARLESGEQESGLSYWKSVLADAPRSLGLPADAPAGRPEGATGHVRLHLPRELLARAARHVRGGNATPFTLLSAALSLVVSRWTGAEDVAFGVVTSGRQGSAALESLIGCFVNTLVLRVRVPGEASLSTYLDQVQDAVLAALEHGDVPFEKVLQTAVHERWGERAPFSELVINVVNTPGERLSFAGLEARLDAPVDVGAKSDITLYAFEQEGLVLDAVFREDRFSRDTLEALVDEVRAVVETLAASPETCVAQVSLVTESARRVLPEPSRPLSAEFRGSIPQRFAAACDAAPEAIAVFHEEAGGPLTYRELDAASNLVALRLVERGVRQGEVVAIHACRSPLLVCSILGILKSGAAFMVVDPAYPAPRIAAMLEQAKPRVLIHLEAAGPVDDSLRQLLSELESSVLPLPVSVRSFVEEALRVAAPRLQPGLGPDSPAYVAFTSGSTGRPKGVLGRHGSLTHFLDWTLRTFGLSSADRYSQLSGLAHDPLHRDVFTPLATGGAVCIPPADVFDEPSALARWVLRARVSVMHLTPSLGKLLARSCEVAGTSPLVDLRRVFLVGEALRRTDVRRMMALAPHLLCINYYGSTETQRAVSYLEVSGPALSGERYPQDVLPLGKGIQDVELLVVRPDGGLAGIGERGEIFLRSPHVALGYVGDPELTARRFVPNPAAPLGDLCYRTGDLGRYLPDGVVEALGRSDDQVKIRGYRIELGDVAAALRADARVREAVVVHEAGEGADGHRLIAYVVADPAEGLAEALRDVCLQKLPPYMVPTDVVVLERFPLTPNGKVDRRALPRPPSRAQREGRPPQGPVEERIAALWKELLGVPSVAATDGFFELGGHSLVAMQVLARVNAAFDTAVSLRELFAAPTVAGLAERVLASPRGEGGERPRRKAAAGALSREQQRIWVLEKLEPGTHVHNMAGLYRLRGALDVERLRRAFLRVSERHETLRTRFVEDEGVPRAIVEAPREVLEVVEVPGGRDAEREALASATGLIRRPFSLAEEHPFRARLVRLSAEEQVLAVVLHHIAADGWSLGVLIEELSQAYAGRDEAPPPPSYSEYVAWQEERLGGGLESELARLREELAGVGALRLPQDKQPPTKRRFTGGHLPGALGATEARGLRRLAMERGTTPFAVLLAAYGVMLWRLSGSASFAVGYPLARRERREWEGLIGCLLNTAVVRFDFRGDERFSDVVDHVHRSVCRGLERADIPFELLQAGERPLFSAMFTLQRTLPPLPVLEGCRVERVPFEIGYAKFDLQIDAIETEGGYELDLEYDAELFTEGSGRRMLELFVSTLGSALATPHEGVSALSVLPPGQAAWLESLASGPRVERRGEPLLHERFEQWAERTPSAVAITHRGQDTSYAELHRTVRRLARALTGAGVRVNDVVALYLPRGAAYIASCLGTLQAGGGFLPLDRVHPLERVATQVRTAQPRALVTLESERGAVEALLRAAGQEHLPIIVVERLESEVTGDERRESVPTARDLAYVAFTSGSTGVPKGAMLEHAGLLNHVLGNVEVLGLTGADVMLQSAAPSFDISVWQCLTPLVLGGRVVVADDAVVRDPLELAGLLERERVTFAQVVPAVLARLLDEAPEVLARSRLRLLSVTGEACAASLARTWLERFPSVPLVNAYGPAECSDDVTLHVATRPEPEARGSLSIGRPLPNLRIEVLDPWLQRVPLGTVGELYVAGEGVGRGYLGDPRLTAERFLPDPHAERPGARMYRTSDFGRYREDGTLEFLGRQDDQVKVRGQRVDLGEIASVLAACPGVREAAVVYRRDEQGGGQLVAYLSARRESGGTLEAREAKRWCEERLPSAMVPSHFVLLEALPLSRSGKVDRKSLPAPTRESLPVGEAHQPPEGPVETELAAIWAQVLRVERVGAGDNFFDLGGNSLLAVQVRAKVQARFGEQLRLEDVFENQTLRQLAARLQHRRPEKAPPQVLEALLNKVSELSEEEARALLEKMGDKS